MGRNLLENIIPDSDSEKAIELACTLVAQLIKSAIDELHPLQYSFVPATHKFGLTSDAIHGVDLQQSICGAPLVDVDERIGARLKELLATS